MRREFHVQFCERVGVRFPCATRRNIYVGSRSAGERVMASVTDFLEGKLKLKVNQAKSAVAPPWERKFLGYSVSWHTQPRLRIHEASLKRFEDKVREVLRGSHGRSVAGNIERLNPVLRGWAAYFRLTQFKRALEDLDGWIRRKLRCVVWRQWKHPAIRARQLQRRGLPEARACKSAYNGHGPWANAGARHMNEAYPKRFFDQMGLVSLLDTQRRLQRVS